MSKQKTIMIVSSMMLISLIVGGVFISMGGKRSDVYLNNYMISEDGNKMILDVSVMGSMGYVRNLKIKQGGDNKYITFYSTFGLNNRLGAKDKFEIDLNSFCGDLYFYSGDGGYRLVLEKDNEKDTWTIIK